MPIKILFLCVSQSDTMRTGTLQPGPRCSSTSRSRAARVLPSAHLGRQRVAVGLQIHGFAGFRRAGVIDALGSRPAAATLQAAVQRSLGAPRSRGARMVTHAMFERFTEKAIKVVMLAQEEARRLGERRAALPGCTRRTHALKRHRLWNVPVRCRSVSKTLDMPLHGDPSGCPPGGPAHLPATAFGLPPTNM